MDISANGLKDQAFRMQDQADVFIAYEGQERATAFLRATCAHMSGLALFQGPSLSGKSTILKQFAAEQRKRSAVALIDGTGLDASDFLATLLRNFGYEYQFDNVNELLGLLKVFIRQQTATATAPLLVIENVHQMTPKALRILCELAAIRVREKFALKLVLVSDRPVNYIVRSPAMACLSKRLTGDLHLEPLTMAETNDYLFAKMRGAGCEDPDRVFPESVCDEIHHASGGWPGLIDRIAARALACTDTYPVDIGAIEHPAVPQRTGNADYVDDRRSTGKNSPDYPVIFVTHNGKTIDKIKFKGARLLIGRSKHNDVTIDSRFISRHHTLLVRNGSSTLLMDLNSANGSYVNSWRVSNQVLLHNDLMTIGEHGLKFVHAVARDRAAFESDSFADTVVMQSMADMRRVLAREHTEAMPVKPQPVEVRDESN